MAEKRSSVGGEKGGVRRATGCPVKQRCVSFPDYTEWWCIPFRSFLSSREVCIYTKIFSSQWCMIDELRHPLVQVPKRAASGRQAEEKEKKKGKKVVAQCIGCVSSGNFPELHIEMSTRISQGPVVAQMGIKFPLLFIQESFIQEDFEIKYCCVPKSSHQVVLLVAFFPFCLLFNL